MPSYTRNNFRRRSRSVRRLAAAVVLTTALGATLAACGDDSDGGSPSATQTARNGDVYNKADVSFASDMIQHHAQAMQMVAMADAHKLDPEVRQLTEDIRAAQTTEIETMADWLTAWDKEIPRTAMDHGNAGHDMDDPSEMGDMSHMEGMEGSEDMPGMMSADDMTMLGNASDPEFQDMWLEMMVEHHKGAIEMAKSEQKDGKFSDAIELARTIESAQEQEIEQMEGLLG